MFRTLMIVLPLIVAVAAVTTMRHSFAVRLIAVAAMALCFSIGLGGLLAPHRLAEEKLGIQPSADWDRGARRAWSIRLSRFSFRVLVGSFFWLCDLCARSKRTDCGVAEHDEPAADSLLVCLVLAAKMLVVPRAPSQRQLLGLSDAVLLVATADQSRRSGWSPRLLVSAGGPPSRHGRGRQAIRRPSSPAQCVRGRTSQLPSRQSRQRNQLIRERPR